MLTFAYPWLLGLVVLPLLLRWLLPSFEQPRSAIRVPMFDVAVDALGASPGKGAVVRRRRWSQTLAFAICWLTLSISLARPQWLGDPIVREVATRDLLLAVDLSGSMETEDFTDQNDNRADRLTATKQVLGDFLAQRKGDRVGMVVFGSGAFVQIPFTQDLDVCQELLNELYPRMAGPKTALGDAIGLGITLFERSDMDSKVLIAMTDGNDTGSRVPPAEAAKIAADKGIVIHTIGVGDPEAAGEELLDEEALKQVAKETSGNYFRAEDRDRLAMVYEKLDSMDTREVKTVSHRPRSELFAWFLAVTMVISILHHAVWGVLTAVQRLKIVSRADRDEASSDVLQTQRGVAG
ncbi:von Willebrand factor type A domain protein [Rubripirellula amarantea]|uniref:von Willebrand factor type A domain protein n=1 Tax=Rubripirellula amarantea TaxID=2527999 RepID=A0A5C5WR68_9BACT|nr:VWA domain-containing protein [Rubripirellula amarantea]TWT52960.1 von Willebrand factor type A domain protein [Rubripirellula amarantea]